LIELYSSVLWQVELVSDKLVYVKEEGISKHSTESVDRFFPYCLSTM
jgi:hypothetical protein